jgi:SAM-dependent methyltransferase
MREGEIVDAVVEYYETRLASFGATARGVDWKDEASQTKRFEQLVRALRLDERSGHFTILDFGCGYGALVPFLRRRGFDFAYTGYDRSPRMIANATRAWPEGAFVSDWEAVPPVDYVVASGVFNVRLATADDQWRTYVLRTLASIHARATVGWAANFLTSFSDADRRRADLHYADPSAMLAWCQQSASRWVSILHDYELHEFTVGVLRRPV